MHICTCTHCIRVSVYVHVSMCVSVYVCMCWVYRSEEIFHVQRRLFTTTTHWQVCDSLTGALSHTTAAPLYIHNSLSQLSLMSHEWQRHVWWQHWHRSVWQCCMSDSVACVTVSHEWQCHMSDSVTCVTVSHSTEHVHVLYTLQQTRVVVLNNSVMLPMLLAFAAVVQAVWRVADVLNVNKKVSRVSLCRRCTHVYLVRCGGSKW